MVDQMFSLRKEEQEEGLAPSAQTFVGQPCLIIGAGGVGHRIVLYLKALLIGIFGSMPAGIRLLVFDIDEESLSVRVGERLVALERDAESFCLGPVPVARIRHNLDNLETIRDRLPSLTDLPSIAVARAAKQLRPVGQLALQWQFPRMRKLTQEAIWRLAGRGHRGDEKLQVDPSRGLKIIQVGSNCGGTNAGMFIDIGCLVRHELEALGTLGDACSVIGIGMLPGAFRGISGPNLVPNTVASLLELEAVMMNGHQPFIYRDGTVIRNTRPPFDMYLLVDAVDEGGRVWANHEDLAQMVSQAILVMAASRLGEQGEGELDNLDDVLSQRTIDGHGTFFGSLGLATLEFPATTIATLFTARHGYDLVTDGLLKATDNQAMEKVARSWLQGQGLADTTLLAMLGRDEAGLPLAVTADLPASARRLPEHQLPQEATQFIQAYARLRVDEDFREMIRRNGLAFSEQGAKRLSQQVLNMVNDPRFGLVAGQVFLAAVLADVGQLQARLSTRRQTVKTAETEEQEGVELAMRELIQSPDALWLLRRNRVASALDHYLRTSQTMLELRFEGMILEEALAVVAKIVEQGHELARQLGMLEGRLRTVASLLAQEVRMTAAKLERRQGHPALALLDRSYLNRLYQRHAPDLGVSVAAFETRLGEEGLAGWHGEDAGKLAMAVKEACRAGFEVVGSMTIEEVLVTRQDYSAEARLAALLDEAQPAWNLDETRLIGGDAGLRRITVIGVPDQTRSVFREHGTQVVSTHDPHSILALSLTLGAPYTALQAWPGYVAEYERVRKVRPLHTLPAFQREDQEVGLALALGLIFGQVFTRGVYFYYQPADELAAEVRLAQGAANALKSLAMRERLAGEILKRVEAEIEHIGIGQALERLMAYVKPENGEDELTRTLKLAVREYAEMLQANARVAGRRKA